MRELAFLLATSLSSKRDWQRADHIKVMKRWDTIAPLSQNKEATSYMLHENTHRDSQQAGHQPILQPWHLQTSYIQASQQVNNLETLSVKEISTHFTWITIHNKNTVSHHLNTLQDYRTIFQHALIFPYHYNTIWALQIYTAVHMATKGT